MKLKLGIIVSLIIAALALISCNIDPLGRGFVLPEKGQLNYDWGTCPPGAP